MIKKKILFVGILTLLLVVIIPSVALAAQKTADFEDLGFGDGKPLSHTTPIDGFLFKGPNDEGMIYNEQYGKDNTDSVYPRSTGKAVTTLSIKLEDGRKFKLTSIWMESDMYASDEVTVEGYLDGSLVPGCSILKQNIYSDKTITLNWTEYIDEIRITATSKYNEKYDLAGASIDNIVYEPIDNAPTVDTNAGITLNEGDTITITNTQLSSSDDNNVASDITYTITDLPDNGAFKKSGTTIAVNGTFTQADIDNNLITYVHNGSDTTSDSFTFKVSDSTNELTGQTFNIEITAVDDPPTIKTNKTITLNEGATVSISSSFLEASDPDTGNANLRFTITSVPSNGQIENSDSSGTAISSFTQADIIDGKINYVHNSSNTTSDSFKFKVSDSTNELTNQTFNIEVTPVDDDTPTISTNNGLPDYPFTSSVRFYTGETKAITTDLLEANDTDTDNATLTYTITSAPSNGRIENRDNAGTVILSFTQQNLIDGKIQYVHDGGNSESDSFIFKVSDGKNELTGQTFTITISVSVGKITFTNSEVTMDVGVISALNRTFPYSITPSNALNKDVTFTSSNPAVATVDNASGMVTSISPGVSKITIISDEKPAVKAECILKVQDPTPPPADAPKRTIHGKLLDGSGNPLVGYHITLCSTPRTVVTNSLGEFEFPDSTYSNHILIINDPAMREVNRFALNFTQGASTTSTVNNTARTIDVTYTNYTSQIDIGLQTNTEGSAVSATAVVFTNTPPVIKNSAKVQNPETGDSSLPYSSMVAGMISLMVLAGIGVIARRKQES